jgi:putative copper resistance protein D
MLAATGLPGLPQAPAWVEWALPLTRYARDISSMLVLGLVVVGLLMATWDRARSWAIAWSGVWLALLCAQYLLTLADVRAQGLTDVAASVLTTLTSSAIGWSFLLQAIAILVAIVLLITWKTRAGAISTAVVVALGCAAPAAVSHAGHSHVAASVSIAIHIVAVSLWVGGLATVLVIAVTTHSTIALPRFSAMALWCVIVVAETGLLNASLLVPTPWSFLGSEYGALILAKAVLLGLLVRWGWRQRRSLGGTGSLARFAGLEFVVMSSAIAASIVLARLGPPVLAPRSLDPLAVAALALGAPLLLARLPLRPQLFARMTALPEATAVVLLMVVALSFVVTGTAAPAAARQIYLSPATVLIPLLVTLALLAAGWLWACTSRGWPAVSIALIGWVIVVVIAQVRADAPDWRWTAVAIGVGIGCILTTSPITSRMRAVER